MKKFDIYEPILDPIGEDNEADIIYLMALGLTEQQAREKIRKGWRFPKDEENE